MFYHGSIMGHKCGYVVSQNKIRQYICQTEKAIAVCRTARHEGEEMLVVCGEQLQIDLVICEQKIVL